MHMHHNTTFADGYIHLLGILEDLEVRIGRIMYDCSCSSKYRKQKLFQILYSSYNSWLMVHKIFRLSYIILH